MGNRHKYKYHLYKGDEHVISGYRDEIANSLGINKNVLASCYRSGLKCRGYTIRRDYDPKPVKRKTTEEPKISIDVRKETSTAGIIDYLKRNLLNTSTHNTCLVQDPSPYLEILREEGIECTFRKVDTSRKSDVFYVIYMENYKEYMEGKGNGQ